MTQGEGIKKKRPVLVEKELILQKLDIYTAYKMEHAESASAGH
jgi:hypothetical protein